VPSNLFHISFFFSMWYMTHPYALHDLLIRASLSSRWFRDNSSYIQHATFICVIWLIHVWHDSFMHACMSSRWVRADLEMRHIWLAIFMCVWHELDSNAHIWESTTHCSACQTLQHTATHCNILQCSFSSHRSWDDSWHIWHAIFMCLWHELDSTEWVWESTTHYNTLQHTATHCNTLPHAAIYCNTLHTLHCSVSSRRSWDDSWHIWHTHLTCLVHLRRDAWLICMWYESESKRYPQDSRTTMQHTATRCNTLQHPATPCRHVRITPQ